MLLKYLQICCLIFISLSNISNTSSVVHPRGLDDSDGTSTRDLQVELSAEQKDWWQTSILYQIYPRSFKDTNGDGLGDLKGITEKLDHFVDLGVESLWIQPFYPSGGADMGYDVSDYNDVDKELGTLQDFDSLLAEAHKNGLKILLDFIPNHSSDEHDWFKKSVARIKPFDEYYLWHDGIIVNATTGERKPPNNWLSIFQGSAWTWNEQRKQFYYHMFNVKQPDLNHRSEAVKQAMRDVIKFWFDRGVDGLRIDAARYMYESADLTDEIYKPAKDGILNPNDFVQTADLPEVYETLAEWRKIADSYKEKDNRTRVMVIESYTTMEHTMSFYKYKGQPVAHYPFNMMLVTDVNKNINASKMSGIITEWMTNMPQGEVANWQYDNHDNPRIASKVGDELVDAFNMLVLLLPGVGVTYFGDEIGMENALVRGDERKDPNNAEGPTTDIPRDAYRTPMQWDDSISAGFSTAAKTWLPVATNYWRLNLEAQKKATWSHYKVYKTLAELRKTETIINGGVTTHAMNGNRVFAATRTLEKKDRYITLINFNSISEEVKLSGNIDAIADNLYVVVPSVNSAYKVGQRVASDPKVDAKEKIYLRPKESLVLIQTADGKPPELRNTVSSAGKNVVGAYLLVASILLMISR